MLNNDSSLFEVNIENYSGPLDVLLDLAKAQKVNLENISITKLADQFHEFITNDKNLNLEVASEYLLIATWLAYLKSKLLLPSTPEEEFKIQEVAEKLKLQLKKLELIRLLSDFEKDEAKKVDVIIHGIETIGSAERSCNPQEMSYMYNHISGGQYANLLHAQFTKERVQKELQDFLSQKFFKRSGGGIGVTRMIRAMKLSNLL